MVFRPYNAIGVLLFPLSKTGKLAVVEPTLVGILEQASVSNWCYLRIGYRDKYEIVKVINSQLTGIHVCRAQDNTEALAFPAGAVVEYILTASEISDSVEPTQLAIYDYDAIQVSNQNIKYKEVSISFFGVNYLIGQNSSKISIGRTKNAYGCCNGNNEPAPIGGQYFIFTSKIYPLELIERTIGNHSVVKGTLQGIDFYESYVSSAECLEGSLPVVTAYIQVEYTTQYSPETGLIRSENFEAEARLIFADLPVVADYKLFTTVQEFEASAQLIAGNLPIVTAYIQVEYNEEFEANAELVSGTLV